MKVDEDLHLWDTVAYNANRYPTQYLKDSKVYYYVRSSADFTNDTMSNIALNKNPLKYWIRYDENQDGDLTNDHSYILFDSASNLKTFYGI